MIQLVYAERLVQLSVKVGSTVELRSSVEPCVASEHGNMVVQAEDPPGKLGQSLDFAA